MLAYCQVRELGRDHVCCENRHRAGVYGMIEGYTYAQSGHYDKGKRNGQPKLVRDDGKNGMERNAMEQMK